MTTDNFDVPYILEKLRELESKIASITRRNTELGMVSNASKDIGDLEMRMVDDNGTTRMICSPDDVYDEFGVHAFLAALSEYGFPTAWIDANTGDIVGAGGNAKLTDVGFIASSIPILFESLGQKYTRILSMNGYEESESGSTIGATAYDILFDKQTLGSELVASGTFGTGWEDDWDDYFSDDYEIIEHKGGNALHIGFYSGIMQDGIGIDDTSIYLVTFEAIGRVTVILQDTNNIAYRDPRLAYSNEFSSWTKVSLVFRGIVPAYQFQLLVGAYTLTLDEEGMPVYNWGDLSITNISVKKITDAVGFVHDIKNDAIYCYGSVLSEANTDTKEPTGWVDPDGIDVSYNKTTRKITLTGNLSYYWRGMKKSLTSPWTSSAHTDAAGNYYLYSTDGDTFAWSTDAWEFYELMVAKAVYGASDKFALRETHGLMPWQVHEELHETVSAFRESGGELTAGTYAENTATDAANSPGFDAAEIQDEDLHVTIPAWTQGTYTTMRIGASSVATFDTTATLPFRYGASYLYYNTPSSGAETAASNNRYLNVYQILVPVASDSDSQKYRMLMLQPQAEYTSLAAAKAEDPRSLSFGDFTTSAPEFVIYARITYVTASGDTNNGKCRIATGGITYLAGTKLTQVSVSGFAAPTAENIPLTPTGSISSTNVQAGIAELDTEKISGTLTSGRIPFANGTNSLTDESGLTWNTAAKILGVSDGTVSVAVAYPASTVAYLGTLSNHPLKFIANNSVKMVLNAAGNLILSDTTDGMTAGGSIAIAQDLAHRGSYVGFYNKTPVTRPAAPTIGAMTVSGTADTTYSTNERDMINQLKADVATLRAAVVSLTNKLDQAGVGLISGTAT